MASAELDLLFVITGITIDSVVVVFAVLIESEREIG